MSGISDIDAVNYMIEGLTSKHLQNNISIPLSRRIQGGPVVTSTIPGKLAVLFPPGFSLEPGFVGPPNPDDVIIQKLANFYGLTVIEFCKRNPAICENPVWGLVTVGGEQFDSVTILHLFTKWKLNHGSIRSNFYELLFCNGNTPCPIWGGFLGVDTDWLKENNPYWAQGYENEGDMFFLREFAQICWVMLRNGMFDEITKEKVTNYMLSVLTEMQTAWLLSEKQREYIEMIKEVVRTGVIPAECFFYIMTRLLKPIPQLDPQSITCN